jgi:hypothetical protein
MGSAAQEGRAEPIGWQAMEHRAEERVVEGKRVQEHHATLVLRNAAREEITLTEYRASWSAPTLQSNEVGSTMQRTMLPGHEFRIPLIAQLQCLSPTAACQFPFGPRWRIEVKGSRPGVGTWRTLFEVALPSRPGGPLSPVVAVRSEAGQSSGAASVVPFELRSNLIVVRGAVAGRPVLLAVDTGAQITMLSPEAAGRLGIDVGAAVGRIPLFGVGPDPVETPIVALRTLRLGPHEVDNLFVGIVLSPMIRTLGIDGILGADFLDAFRLTIDRRARELRLDVAR